MPSLWWMLRQQDGDKNKKKIKIFSLFSLMPWRRVARWFAFKPKIRIFPGILNILLSFGTFCEHFSGFGLTWQNKSGNPALAAYPSGIVSA
jgi:hypothetical protein